MHTAALSHSTFDASNGGYEPPQDGGKHQAWLIQGVNDEGLRFRPSDWAERICGLMAGFQGGRLHYSALLYPSSVNGIKCVHMDDRLQSIAPAIHLQVMEFVRNNQLNMLESL